MDKARSEVLTEENFEQAAKRQYAHKFTKDTLEHLKKGLVGQPVWQQDLPCQELNEGEFDCWGDYVV